MGIVKYGYDWSGLCTLNWMYLNNEQMELTDFLHAGTNLRKLKGD